MKHFRRIAAIQLLSSFVLAQQGAEPPTRQATDISFRARSELVLVPMHVQRKGEHAAGLKREQLTLSDNGVTQEIVVFEEVRAKSGKLEVQSFTPGEFGTLTVNTNPRLTVIAFDAITTPKLQQTYFRGEVLKFLDYAATSNVPIGIVSLEPRGVRVIADFTTDPAVLAAAIHQMKSTSTAKSETLGVRHQDVDTMLNFVPGGEVGRLGRLLNAFWNMRETQEELGTIMDRSAHFSALDVLDQLAQGLSGIPGRKALVWAGAGFPINPGLIRDQKSSEVVPGLGDRLPVTMDISNTTADMGRQKQTLERLNAANIAVYPVDTRGLTNPAYLEMDKKYASDAENYARHARDQQIVAMFRDVARMTGGKPCVGTPDMAKCLRETLDDGEQYYLVGYYHKKPAQLGWHEVQVKVRGEGLKVRAPSGYVVAPESAKDPNRDLALALASPLDSTALSFRGAWNKPAESASTTGFSLQIPAQSVQLDFSDGNHMSFDLYLAGYTKTGERTLLLNQRIDRRLNPDQIQQLQTAGIQYRNRVAIPPDIVRVRFVVRDNLSGRIGSATTLPPSASN